MPTFGDPYRFVNGVELPAPPFDGVSVCVPRAMVPLILGGIETRARTYIWAAVDALDGIELLREAQLALMTPCQDTANLYRLLSTVLLGTTYTGAGESITPAIPEYPELVYTPDSLLGKLDALATAETADDTDIEGILTAVELAATLLA